MATSSTPILERIAAKLSNSNGDYIAMATLISPSIALTAAHNVENHQGYFLDQDRTRGAHPRARLHPVEATVIARDIEFEFAALKLESKLKANLPSTLLSVNDPELAATWECLYVPALGDEPTRISGMVEGIELVGGHRRLKLKPFEIRAFNLTLGASGAPPIVALDLTPSGAPILIDDHLVGIVASHDERSGYWFATPVTEMMKSPHWKLISESMKPSLSPKQPHRTGEFDFDTAAFLKRLSTSSLTALQHANGTPQRSTAGPIAHGTPDRRALSKEAWANTQGVPAGKCR